MELTDDEVEMFYAIYTVAERVDWARYESFRARVLKEGARRDVQTKGRRYEVLSTRVGSFDGGAGADCLG